MKELSLHLLDIVQNSIRAKASEIIIKIVERPSQNRFEMVVEDNGKGIDEDMLPTVTDPFTTSRTTRKVGLGLPLLKSTCHLCNGNFEIESKEGKGTKVVASMEYNSIDRPPLGKMATTLLGLFASYENINFIYQHQYEENQFVVDIKDIQEILDGVPLSNIEVYQWLLEYIQDNLENIKNINDNNLTNIQDQTMK